MLPPPAGAGPEHSHRDHHCGRARDRHGACHPQEGPPPGGAHPGLLSGLQGRQQLPHARVNAGFLPVFFSGGLPARAPAPARRFPQPAGGGRRRGVSVEVLESSAPGVWCSMVSVGFHPPLVFSQHFLRGVVRHTAAAPRDLERAATRIKEEYRAGGGAVGIFVLSHYFGAARAPRAVRNTFFSTESEHSDGASYSAGMWPAQQLCAGHSDFNGAF